VDILETLWRIVLEFKTLAVELLALALQWGVVIAWVAWWLWGVNWKKLWPVLALGAWVPVVLLMVLVALAWSRLEPVGCTFLGLDIGNFWWQLGAVGLLACSALLCGWIQGHLGWEPAEINLEPPVATAHGHDHH
jgi:hypothetical protein